MSDQIVSFQNQEQNSPYHKTGFVSDSIAFLLKPGVKESPDLLSGVNQIFSTNRLLFAQLEFIPDIYLKIQIRILFRTIKSMALVVALELPYPSVRLK